MFLVLVAVLAAGWLAGCWLAGWLAGWLLGGWLAGWLLAGWLAAGWLVAGWLAAGWLTGWLLAGCWLAGQLLIYNLISNLTSACMWPCLLTSAVLGLSLSLSRLGEFI